METTRLNLHVNVLNSLKVLPVKQKVYIQLFKFSLASKFQKAHIIIGFLAALSIPVDACASSPCKNGAKCESEGDHYVCNCKVNFEGIHCEEKGDKKNY